MLPEVPGLPAVDGSAELCLNLDTGGLGPSYQGAVRGPQVGIWQNGKFAWKPQTFSLEVP